MQARGEQVLIMSPESLQVTNVPDILSQVAAEREGFFAVGRMRTIALNGERPTALTPVIVDAAGAAWHGDVILIVRGASSLLRVPAGGGRPTEASEPRTDGGGHRWPQFLSDGRLLFLVRSRAHHRDAMSFRAGSVAQAQPDA